MKTMVSLNQLLNGNSMAKKPKKTKETKNVEPETIELLDSPKKEDEAKPIQTKKSKIVPIGDNVSTDSVKNFLMMKPASIPKDKIKSKRKNNSNLNIISLDDTEEDQLTMQEVINLENENFQNIINPKRLSGPITNVKRTNLKDLFSNKRKLKDDEQLDDEEEYKTRPFKRLNQISKLSDLQTPLPSKQSIQPNDLENISQYDDIDIKQLTPKILHNETSEYIFDSNDYELLRNRVNEDITTNIIETSIKHANHTTLWTDLFQPKTLSEVLLDTRLKRAVNKWVNDAFNKLKKPTTRHTLINSRKNLKSTEPGTLLFDGFIIPDDMIDDEEEEEDLEEFVPLMILHGDGVGKRTLLNIIIQEMQGQIMDISSSQNRSKKELLDTLLEYCTSYYVKDKKSNGIVLFDDVDVLFREHDKQFWAMVETLLLKSRKPIVLICKDINFIPTNLIDLCEEAKSIFEAKKVLSKTILAFLTEYCNTVGLDVPTDILLSIIKSNQKDIRKCLYQLQFLFSYKNNLTIIQGSTEYKITLPSPQTISDYADIHDLISCTEIVDYHTKNKSLIPSDVDLTLMTADAVNFINSTEDEQQRLKHDYMVDYRMHIYDTLINPLMPYEVSIGKYLNHQLKELIGKCPDSSKKLTSMEEKSVNFLTSRIPTPNFYNNRKTRNSRKVKEILDRFQGELDYQRKDNDDTIVDFNFFMTTKRKIAQDLNPYVLEIAKSDALSKSFNKEQFKAASKDVPESEYPDIVNHLSTEGIFRTVHFYSSPDKVVDCWSSLNTMDE